MNLPIKEIILFSAVIFTTIGCASYPEEVKPSYISDIKYKNVPCNELLIEHEKLIEAYRATAKRQTTAANSDVAGVLLIGVPLSGSNDVAYEVARLKGEILAVRRALVTKECSLQPLPGDIVIEPNPNLRKQSTPAVLRFNNIQR
jgi:hypothetical protein